jgi:hypothetical protein
MRLFQQLQQDELSRAREKHEVRLNSLHEGYAVILEELDELWEAVRARRENRDPQAILSELVQIAAMAQRTAEDVVFCAHCQGYGGNIIDRGNGDADSIPCRFCGETGVRV